MPLIKETWLDELIQPYIDVRNTLFDLKKMEKIDVDEYPEMKTVTELVTDEVMAKALGMTKEQIDEMRKKEQEHPDYHLWARAHDGILDWFIFPLERKEIHRYLDEMNGEIGFHLTFDSRIKQEDLLQAISPLLNVRNGLLTEHGITALDFERFPEAGVMVSRVTDMMIGYALKWEESDVRQFHENSEEHPAYDIWNRVHDAVADWFQTHRTDEEIGASLDEINEEIGTFIKGI